MSVITIIIFCALVLHSQGLKIINIIIIIHNGSTIYVIVKEHFCTVAYSIIHRIVDCN